MKTTTSTEAWSTSATFLATTLTITESAQEEDNVIPEVTRIPSTQAATITEFGGGDDGDSSSSISNNNIVGGNTTISTTPSTTTIRYTTPSTTTTSTPPPRKFKL